MEGGTYILRCADEFWSVRNLKAHIEAGDFQEYRNMPNDFLYQFLVKRIYKKHLMLSKVNTFIII